jgi:hypothetical protein
MAQSPCQALVAEAVAHDAYVQVIRAQDTLVIDSGLVATTKKNAFGGSHGCFSTCGVDASVNNSPCSYACLNFNKRSFSCISSIRFR